MLKKSIHRDLKPENIVIEYTDNDKLNFNVKLTDFGLSTFGTSIRTHTLAGTRKYYTPEIDTFNYNNKCDLWSLGVILYELYTNKYIFDSENNRQKGIKKTDNKLINKLIKVNIEERIK